MNVPRILKGESKRFRSAQENIKKSKVVVKKVDNVKVDGLKLSINIYPTFDYTFTLNAIGCLFSFQHLMLSFFNSYGTGGGKCVEIVKTLHVKFFPFW